MPASGQGRGAAEGEPPAKQAKTGAGQVSYELLEERISKTQVTSAAPEGRFICTHHGSFHADEAMACAMLKCLEEFADLPIVRTRNSADIDKAAIVADVGGTYEPEKHRYDHHQKSFTDTYSADYPEIKLSSAGLIFKHFGGQVIEALCGKLDEKTRGKLVAKTYDSLVRELDALDNGISVAEKPLYRFCTHLGARVGRLNPGWQESGGPALENERFQKAVLLAAKELTDVVVGYHTGWLPARVIVESALEQRREVHPSGEIMKLPRFCPWQEHLFDIESEEEAARTPLTKYVLFEDSRGGWRIQAVPKERGSFQNRLPLPKPWCGLRDKELSDLVGLPGCVFVHASGFIGGHADEAGALEMAKRALDEHAKQ